MPHFIAEGAIFQEAEVIQKRPDKAIFRMTLQTCDEINKNRRMYPQQAMTNAMGDCKERMSRKAFYGEMDHPIPKGNQNFDSVRQTMVSLKEVSHYIRDFEFRGNILVGECETASTPNGDILFGLIKDQSGVGMSMRGMAELERKSDYNLVKDPLMIVSYDSVSLPSHQAAVVDFTEMQFESQMITESAQSGIICYGDKCFMPNYFDKLVETKMIQFFEKWV